MFRHARLLNYSRVALAYRNVARAAAAHRYDETRATRVTELVHRPNADGGEDEREGGGGAADDADAALVLATLGRVLHVRPSRALRDGESRLRERAGGPL